MDMPEDLKFLTLQHFLVVLHLHNTMQAPVLVLVAVVVLSTMEEEKEEEGEGYQVVDLTLDLGVSTMVIVVREEDRMEQKDKAVGE